MRFKKNKIILDKEVNELDRFVVRFIRVLEKYSDYVIISGYVSILFGRSRATEDIDIFRYAFKGTIIPNFEVKFAVRAADVEAFNGRVTVVLQIGELKISSLERQVAFKKYYLGTPKDIEDAAYIENLFKGRISRRLIEEYKQVINAISKDEEAKTRKKQR